MRHEPMNPSLVRTDRRPLLFLCTQTRPIPNTPFKDCLQLDTKLICAKCKALQCDCPGGASERLCISSLAENPHSNGSSSSSTSRLNAQTSTPVAQSPSSSSGVAEGSSRFAWSSNKSATNNTAAGAEVDDRPAGIRLASILGLKRPTETEATRSGSSGMRRTDSKENVTSSPAANWFKDKYQMATNKLMSKV